MYELTNLCFNLHSCLDLLQPILGKNRFTLFFQAYVFMCLFPYSAVSKSHNVGLDPMSTMKRSLSKSEIIKDFKCCYN